MALVPRTPWARGVLVALVVVALVLGGAALWRLRPGPGPLEEVVAVAPPTTKRVSWVDWRAAREELGGDVGAGSSPAEVDDLMTRAYEADVTATSALALSAPTMQRSLGFSPASIDWEALLQGDDGTALVMGASQVDLDAVAEDLGRAGFTAPSGDDGVWRGGFDVLARLGGELTPPLAHVALLRDEGLIVTSEELAYLRSTVAGIRGDETAGMPDVGPAVEALSADGGPPVSASVLTGLQACEALAVPTDDVEADAQARQLVRRAGGVSPLRSYGIGAMPGGSVRVALGYESDDQARGDADARAALASGPAPGPGRSFPERFALERASATGSVVTLRLDPEPDARLLSDLAGGSVLFAAC